MSWAYLTCSSDRLVGKGAFGQVDFYGEHAALVGKDLLALAEISGQVRHQPLQLFHHMLDVFVVEELQFDLDVWS